MPAENQNVVSGDELLEMRWRRMKVLRVEGYKFAAMVPVLQREALLSCHNCAAGKPKPHPRRKVQTVCATCENTLAVQWGRNLARLKEDEATLMDQRFQWFEAQRFIAETARRDYRTKVVTSTVKRKKVEPIEGVLWPVTVRLDDDTLEEKLIPAERIAGLAEVVEISERTEWRIHPQLLEIYGEAHDKMARVVGIPIDEVGDPESERDEPGVIRGLLVKRPTSRSDGDSRTN